MKTHIKTNTLTTEPQNVLRRTKNFKHVAEVTTVGNLRNSTSAILDEFVLLDR